MMIEPKGAHLSPYHMAEELADSSVLTTILAAKCA
jgi:hypothetical protein